MELREGNYHLTEVGLVPCDWEVLNLESNFILKARIGWQGLTTAEYLESGDFGLVTGTDFKNGYIDWNNCVFVERNRYEQDKYIQLRLNDILITKDGTIGKVAFISKLPQPTTLNSGVFVLRPKSDRFDNKFFYFILRSFYFDNFLNKITAGSTITHLYQKDFITFKLISPPLKEQTAIATALSDMDALITQTEKLIAKKKAIKQGVMQCLLSPYDEHGKLKEGWVIKTLGDIAILKARIGWQGLTTAEYRSTGDYLLITGTEFKNGFIDWDNCFYVEEDRYKQDKNIQIKEQDVLVTKDGTIGKVALIDSVPLPATLNSGVFVIRPIDNSFNPAFFYCLLLSEAFKFFLSQLSAGSTINHLYQKDFVTFKFSAPESIDEQVAIAKILSDQDAEIKLLQNRYQKQKAQKQGMMQNLLTGKIRIYKPQHESAATI